MKSKKAVSPLVATILLIAFAVSVGAVVMNWTSATVNGDKGIEGIGNCANVKIITLTKGTQKDICFDRLANKIVMNIENGAHEIQGIRLSYLGETSSFVDFSENIEPGVIKHIELNYDVVRFGELSRVKIVPFVRQGENNLYCTNAGEMFSVVDDCK